MSAPPALHAEWDGAPAPGRPTLVLLHGFTGGAASWAGVRPGLRALGATLAVDLPGHGASPVPVAPGQGSLDACLAGLRALLARHGIDRAWWVGYSLGARVALALALAYPDAVAGLVLESGTAGLDDPAERAARRARDEALAADIERDGVPAFVERWLALPLFAGLHNLPAEAYAEQRRRRQANSPAGLVAALRGLGAGVVPPLWSRLGELAVPTLLIAGADDGKYVALGRRLHAGIAGSRLHIVPGAGHVPHVERPAAFLHAVTGFLRRHAGT